MIIVLIFCAAVGFAVGFVLRLPAFITLSLLAIVGYAVFRAGMESGWQITYHIVLVGLTLQIGYSAAIVTQTLLRSSSMSKQLPTGNGSRRERGKIRHK